jgi:hypothetical protein
MRKRLIAAAVIVAALAAPAAEAGRQPPAPYYTRTAGYVSRVVGVMPGVRIVTVRTAHGSTSMYTTRYWTPGQDVRVDGWTDGTAVHGDRITK